MSEVMNAEMSKALREATETIPMGTKINYIKLKAPVDKKAKNTAKRERRKVRGK